MGWLLDTLGRRDSDVGCGHAQRVVVNLACQRLTWQATGCTGVFARAAVCRGLLPRAAAGRLPRAVCRGLFAVGCLPCGGYRRGARCGANEKSPARGGPLRGLEKNPAIPTFALLVLSSARSA